MIIAKWRGQKLAEAGVEFLYYLAQIKNLPSIIRHGILPKNEVVRRKLPTQSFANEDVQEKRHHQIIELSDPERTCKGVHDVVPLYFVTRTPTLFSRKNVQSDLVFAEIDVKVVCDENNYCVFSDGNVAAKDTTIYSSLIHLKKIPFEVLEAQYWDDFPDGKRKRCAEFLIYPRVSACYFLRLLVKDKRRMIGARIWWAIQKHQ